MAADNNEWFQKTERRLYAYPALIAKHRRKIIEYNVNHSPKATKYTATSFIRGGEISSEAERWVLKREQIAQQVLFLSEELQEEMDIITSLWEFLSEEEQKLVLLKYFEQKPRYIIEDIMQRTRPTCYKIRCRAVIKAAYFFDFINHDECMNLLAG